MLPSLKYILPPEVVSTQHQISQLGFLRRSLFLLNHRLQVLTGQALRRDLLTMVTHPDLLSPCHLAQITREHFRGHIPGRRRRLRRYQETSLAKCQTLPHHLLQQPQNSLHSLIQLRPLKFNGRFQAVHLGQQMEGGTIAYILAIYQCSFPVLGLCHMILLLKTGPYQKLKPQKHSCPPQMVFVLDSHLEPSRSRAQLSRSLHLLEEGTIINTQCHTISSPSWNQGRPTLDQIRRYRRQLVQQ
jgi:hypothetical protein